MKKGRTYGAKALVKTLEKLGVDVVFGYPGGANLPIYEALASSSIKHVLARHEQGASHMADGYARATGRVGVCLATSGPGATNLVTGIATAYMDSIPMLAITGQVPRINIGTDAFQEVDTTGITIPITKHNLLVQEVKEIPSRIEEAFHIASTGRKGPVLIDIPKDVLFEEFTLPDPKEIILEGYSPNSEGHPGQIKRAVKILEQAKRPLIMAGGGIIASESFDELKAFAEKTNIPLIHTFMGKAALDDNHPLNLGMCGYHGKVVSNQAIDQSDVILALGARFSNRHTINLETYPGHKKIIHIDIDPAEIGKNVETLLPIVGDLKQILTRFIDLIKPGKNTEWISHLKDIDSRALLPIVPENGLTQIAAMRIMQEYLDNPLIITDVGRHQMFAAHEMKLPSGRNFISSGGLGTMGFSFPASIGAAFGKPDRQIVVIAGDGSFVMNCQEIISAAAEKLNIICFIMNDSRLGMIAQLQDEFYKSSFDISDLGSFVDFPKMAESMGAQGHRIRTQNDMRALMMEKSLYKGVHIVDCVIEKGGEHAYPMVRGRSILDIVEEGGTK
ncbi:biosynthetic-type acetolactate synthase large subunit [Oceanispirochaeta sp.]|uniref:biosynthetic-type acetolactate synthase large subunit n=1 Tax=Oceanispirochaeta sp. TaxID=2035350 RepID=UPI002606FE07|nr:biosynthetic-type acetolactate synthase large subunit [Oceanispirochaeta sp.]MDA3955157.1 biosynthetic-type acetolactate synthase large subunit [Oceanispirochaeta sp.]